MSLIGIERRKGGSEREREREGDEGNHSGWSEKRIGKIRHDGSRVIDA